MEGNEASVIETLLNSREHSFKQEPQMVVSRCGVPQLLSGTAWPQPLPLRSPRQRVSGGGAGVQPIHDITSSRTSWKETELEPRSCPRISRGPPGHRAQECSQASSGEESGVVSVQASYGNPSQGDIVSSGLLRIGSGKQF